METLITPKKDNRSTLRAEAMPNSLMLLREEKGLSRQGFAETFRVLPQQVYDWETGRRPIPRKLLYALSEFFNVLPQALESPPVKKFA